jgi:cobalt/nickel transport system ATP-binding protein
MCAFLEVRNLTFQHPSGATALDNVSFQLSRTENVAVFGPNGSGKTTLLLHLNGTLRGRGSVRVCGLEMSDRNLPEIRRKAGLLFQEADEQLFMPTVLEDVMFGPLNLGWNRQEAERKCRAVLTRVGISDILLDRPPFHLSTGEKRRVALAGVLVMEPEILLLDEPTTSLDPPGQRALLELLRTVPQPKLIATHDVHFAAALSDRAIFLNGGRLIADGKLQDVIERFDWNPYP